MNLENLDIPTTLDGLTKVTQGDSKNITSEEIGQITLLVVLLMSELVQKVMNHEIKKGTN